VVDAENIPRIMVSRFFRPSGPDIWLGSGARPSAAHVQRYQSIHEYQRSDVLRIQPRILQDDRRSHAVSHQNHAIGLRFRTHGFHGPGEQVHRKLAIGGRSALAVAGQVQA
jgi:hypothetical protein